MATHGTACRTCRRRGRKCDRTLPRCLSCEQRRVPCEGYITRWPGVAARGKLAGQSIPVYQGHSSNLEAGPPEATPSSPVMWNDMRSKTASDFNAVMDPRQPYRSSSSIMTLPPCAEDLMMDRLVRHYVNDFSNIFYLGKEQSSNPMFRYVLPLMNTVPPIRYAIAASTLCHVASRSSQPNLDQRSLQLRVQATHMLRQRLSYPGAAMDESIIATILMLAQVDMCSGECLEFETHIQAAIAIIRNLRQGQTSSRHYFEQRLIWLDIMACTTSVRPPFFTIEEIRTSLDRLSTAASREWCYDVFPCPVQLFEVLVDIVMLKKTTRMINVEQTIVEAQDLMGRLNEWTRNDDLRTPRRHTVQIWRLGIKAYLLRLFPSIGQSVQAIKAEAIQLSILVPPATPWSYSLLWPMFQVGLLLDCESAAEKAWITNRLAIAHEAVGCRHFTNALETLRSIWDNPPQMNSPIRNTHGGVVMLA
ncbi:fungal-specific transcription factor domain-containing protein [Stachybotrys elegans]|uniref:Fungal-specific transcription factor domain-containing protein n=1 Tax=Stachybotrys elegans TaxID=80388 RepID=A0A8K0WMP2_9HYPO|nr:fungal-specific transcription factor domain-containing protein [Stachybotrys elegans]